MTDEEKDIVESLVDETERFTKSTTLIKRGQAAGKSMLLIEGYLLQAIREGSRRYVVGMHVPGDFADLHGFALRRMDYDLATVGATRVGYVNHARLAEETQRFPHLGQLLWFSTLIDAAIQRQWILRQQRLSAPRRVAQVFAELWYRLDMVGLGREDGLRTPLIQADLADMCGTTAIHMNRALAALKSEGIAEFRRGTVYVPNRVRLEEYAAFDPGYLCGQRGLRPDAEVPG